MKTIHFYFNRQKSHYVINALDIKNTVDGVEIQCKTLDIADEVYKILKYAYGKAVAIRGVSDGVTFDYFVSLKFDDNYDKYWIEEPLNVEG